MKLPEKYLIAATIALASAALFAGEPKPGVAGNYSVAKTLNVGGEGRWDYVVIDPQTQLLYVPRQSHTQVIKADTGEVVASCGDGTLTVARETSPGKFEVTQTVKTKNGARTMALDPSTHTVYLPTAEFPEGGTHGGGRPAPKAGTFEIVVVKRAGELKPLN